MNKTTQAEFVSFTQEMAQYLEMKLDGYRRVDKLPENHAIVYTADRYLQQAQALLKKAKAS
jgi:hypothetical protein